MHIETIPVKIAGDPFFTTNCYLISSSPESECVVVIDPGDESERILAQIGKRKLTAIVITHGHYDHIGGVAHLAQTTNAPIYAHEEEASRIEEGYETIRKNFARFTERMNSRNKEYEAPVLDNPAPAVDFALVEGDTLDLCGLVFLVLHTPGHSPGCICLYNSQEGVLFSGDTLFKGAHGRTDFAGGNAQEMRDSLSRLATFPPDTKVYPGHDQTTTIGAELRRGLVG